MLVLQAWHDIRLCMCVKHVRQSYLLPMFAGSILPSSRSRCPPAGSLSTSTPLLCRPTASRHSLRALESTGRFALLLLSRIEGRLRRPAADRRGASRRRLRTTRSYLVGLRPRSIPLHLVRVMGERVNIVQLLLRYHHIRIRMTADPHASSILYIYQVHRGTDTRHACEGDTTRYEQSIIVNVM